MAKPPGKCIFCGGSNLTKEHFWPAWMGALIQSPKPVRKVPMRLQTTVRVDYNSGTDQLIKSKELTGHAKSTKFRIVCKSCNNGWMSKIEDNTKPLLERLVIGETVLLGRHDQLILSIWLSLKVLTIDNNSENPISEEATCKAFRNDPQPLSGMTAWIARCEAPSMQSALFRQTALIANQPATALTEDIPHNVQTVSIGVGNVFFHVHHNTGTANINAHFNRGGRFFQIWPVVGELVIWPPIWALTADEARGVSRFLSKFGALRRKG